METENKNNKNQPNPQDFKASLHGGQVIGPKEALADFCWSVVTDGNDPAQFNQFTDDLLKAASAVAVKAGYPKPCLEGLRHVAAYCWREGFTSALAALEAGVFSREEQAIPDMKTGGKN